jgi:hypothetical protein
MSDLLSANFATVQSNQQPAPNTIAAATTIAPQTLNTIVTGTTAVQNITPPVTGQHLLFLTFTDATPGTTVTTGNIANAVVPTQNVPSMFLYNPNTAKYYGWANNLT